MVSKLRDALLRWYSRSHRDLPWRRTRDAYRIWVSEIMLQQTRVETVLPYYDRFLARFPDVRTLADAPLDDVLALWSGLGYYRRARLLHAAAAIVVREHASRFPRALDAARALPGIGRSTAGAIVSISYGERTPVLDGNVKRVLARLFALRGDPDARPLEEKLWQLAQEFVDCAEAGDVNQALMELGATVCLPFAGARCDECPWRSSCLARRDGLVATLPEKSRGARPIAQTWAVAIVERAGRLLVHQRDGAGLLHGMWEFPTCELTAADARAADGRRAALAAWLAQRLALDVEVGGELLLHRHAISNRSVTERVFLAHLRGDGRGDAKARWLAPAAIAALPITTATRRILARLEQERAEAPLFSHRSERSLPGSAAAAPSRSGRSRRRPPRSVP